MGLDWDGSDFDLGRLNLYLYSAEAKRVNGGRIHSEQNKCVLRGFYVGGIV